MRKTPAILSRVLFALSGQVFAQRAAPGSAAAAEARIATALFATSENPASPRNTGTTGTTGTTRTCSHRGDAALRGTVASCEKTSSVAANCPCRSAASLFH